MIFIKLMLFEYFFLRFSYLIIFIYFRLRGSKKSWFIKIFIYVRCNSLFGYIFILIDRTGFILYNTYRFDFLEMFFRVWSVVILYFNCFII